MKRLLRLATWALAALVIALLTVMILIPRITGWIPLTVLTGSMEPSIPAGSMVVVQPLEGKEVVTDVGTGDVITFMPHPDDPTLVTHRVVSQGVRADGTTVFITQGDANGAPDVDPVTAEQVRGTVRYHVPYAGHLSGLLNVDQKQQGIIVVAVGLFAYAGVQALRIVREVTRGRREAAVVGQVPAEDAPTEKAPAVEAPEETTASRELQQV